MFERFADGSRRVVVYAQEEARILAHGYIGTEHLLLGLVREGDDVVVVILARFEVTLEVARSEVENVVGRGESTQAGHIPFTPRAKKVLDRALVEATVAKPFGTVTNISAGLGVRRGRARRVEAAVRPGHILLGLISDNGAKAARVLDRLGVDRTELRRAVVEAMPDARHTEKTHPSQGQPSPVDLMISGEPVLRCPGCDVEIKLAGAPDAVHVRIERGSDDPRFRIYLNGPGDPESVVHECKPDRAP